MELKFVIIDFTLVTKLDSSAINSFTKMNQLTEMKGISLIVTHLPPEIENQFIKSGFSNSLNNNQIDNNSFIIFKDLDNAVEWCENLILKKENEEINKHLDKRKNKNNGDDDLDYVHEDYTRYIEQKKMFKSIIISTSKFTEKRELEKGIYLINQGERYEGIYFLESGQVTIQLLNSDGNKVRIRAMGDGTVVGELGMYLGDSATASVITSKKSVVYYLSSIMLSKMEKEEPDIAILLHRYLAYHISERLIYMNNALQALKY